MDMKPVGQIKNEEEMERVVGGFIIDEDLTAYDPKRTKRASSCKHEHVREEGKSFFCLDCQTFIMV